MSARTMSKAASKKHLATLSLARRRTHLQKRDEGAKYKPGRARIVLKPGTVAANWRHKNT